MSAHPRLKRSTLFYYSLTDMPVMLAIFPALVLIPNYYSESIGISLATITTVLLAVRIFDVITDPLMGYISDRTNSRFGRRKPWIAIAAPMLMLGLYKLYFPPADATWVYLLGWNVVNSFGITMLLIPYYSWGAELSPDYDDRSRITGARAMAGVVGQFIAQFVPAAALFFFAIGGTENILQIVGITMLVLMPICVTVTLVGTPHSTNFVPSKIPVLRGLRIMFANKAFLLLIFSFVLGNLGLTITMPLYFFFTQNVLGAVDQSIYMLCIYFVSNIFGVPFWVWLAGKWGKHRSYILAFVTISLAHPFYLLLGAGDFWYMTPITILVGFAAGGFSQSMPNSMKADVIDSDTLESGENRAALFFSTWSFAQKFAGFFGTAIALYGLSLFGYDPLLGANNSEEAMFGLRFLFSTLPSVFFLAGAFLVWKFPITRERQLEIREELERRGLSAPTS